MRHNRDYAMQNMNSLALMIALCDVILSLGEMHDSITIRKNSMRDLDITRVHCEFFRSEAMSWNRGA